MERGGGGHCTRINLLSLSMTWEPHQAQAQFLVLKGLSDPTTEPNNNAERPDSGILADSHSTYHS